MGAGFGKAGGWTVSKTTRVTKPNNLKKLKFNSMHKGINSVASGNFFFFFWSGKMQYFHIALNLGIDSTEINTIKGILCLKKKKIILEALVG